MSTLPRALERWVRSFVAVLDEVDRGLRPVGHLRRHLDPRCAAQLRRPARPPAPGPPLHIHRVRGVRADGAWEIVVLVVRPGVRGAGGTAGVRAIGLRLVPGPDGRGWLATQVVRPGHAGGAIGPLAPTSDRSAGRRSLGSRGDDPPGWRVARSAAA